MHAFYSKYTQTCTLHLNQSWRPYNHCTHPSNPKHPGRTQQLQNLLTTANLLRHATQALKLLAKLKAQLGPDGRLDTSNGGMLDLAKSAKLISDIEAVCGVVYVLISGIEALICHTSILPHIYSPTHQFPKHQFPTHQFPPHTYLPHTSIPHTGIAGGIAPGCGGY